MPREEEQRPASDRSDDAILAEMRRRWDYATTEWEPIRKNGKVNMLCATGQVWLAVDPKGVDQREKSGRPCLSLDELSQYGNQIINDVRQNKRAIKVTPVGEGANDETAKLKESTIRQIEYRSNAQQVYTTGFENTIQRSYGFWRIVPKYVSEDSDNQELLIDGIVNPDMCTPDPDHQKADGADMRYFWLRESRTKEEFNRQYPDAKFKDFGGFLGTDSSTDYQAWVSEDKCFIAEYWTLETKTRELLTLNTVPPQQVFADMLETKPSKANILKSRKVETSSVMKYITNGLEILERSQWPGKDLPFICCYGKVVYLDSGDGTKRFLLGLYDLARPAAQLYNYYRTAEAEVVGMTPKTPYWAYEGQVSPEQEVQIQKSLHEPVALLKAKPIVDGAGMSVLPLPQRQMYEPRIQALEIGAEAARRAIQAAIGSSPLPTQAQRRNEKSGVALKQIEETAQKGSFHFIDHYEDSIRRTGEILNDLLPHFYDTARDLTIRNPEDQPEVVRINDPTRPDDQTGQPRLMSGGSYDVTLSTGPSYDSEREVAQEFTDTMIGSPQVLQIMGPQVAAKVLSLAIKLKNLGPLGNEMADAISPPEDKRQQIPPEVQAKLQEQEQMLAQAKQMIDTDAAKQQATIQKAQIDAEADFKKAQVDAQVRIQIATIQAETAIATAQIKAGQDGVEARLKHLETVMGHKADFLLQERELEHDDRMADKQHQQAVEEGERGHQHALEEGEQGAQAAERQIERKAEVTPRPEASQ